MQAIVVVDICDDEVDGVNVADDHVVDDVDDNGVMLMMMLLIRLMMLLMMMLNDFDNRWTKRTSVQYFVYDQ